MNFQSVFFFELRQPVKTSVITENVLINSGLILKFRLILNVTLRSTMTAYNGNLQTFDVSWHDPTFRIRNNGLFHVNERNLKIWKEHLELEKICNEQNKTKTVILFPSAVYRKVLQ